MHLQAAGLILVILFSIAAPAGFLEYRVFMAFALIFAMLLAGGGVLLYFGVTMVVYSYSFCHVPFGFRHEPQTRTKR